VIYVLAYLAMTAVAARWLAPRMLDALESEAPDLSDIVVSRVLALSIGLLWPAVALGTLVMWKAPESRGQLKQKLAARDARITELEHDLGIGQK
jgi:hypothetical protein